MTDGNRLHYGTSETYEIRTYTSRGELTRIVRVQRADAPLTQQHIDAYITAAASRIDEPLMRNDFVARMQEMPKPATLPAYAAMLVDAERNLWVADYRLHGESQTRWTIFDTEGRMLGTIQPPPGLTITDIGTDYVLGVARDEFNLEQVAVYRLVKPTA